MDHVGKIVRKRNLFPGPEMTVTNTVGEGIRKGLNMCFVCALFHPRQAGHCQMAQQLFTFSNTHHIGTILYRCAAFVPKLGVEVHQSEHDSGEGNGGGDAEGE